MLFPLEYSNKKVLWWWFTIYVLRILILYNDSILAVHVMSLGCSFNLEQLIVQRDVSVHLDLFACDYAARRVALSVAVRGRCWWLVGWWRGGGLAAGPITGLFLFLMVTLLVRMALLIFLTGFRFVIFLALLFLFVFFLCKKRHWWENRCCMPLLITLLVFLDFLSFLCLLWTSNAVPSSTAQFIYIVRSSS